MALVGDFLQLNTEDSATGSMAKRVSWAHASGGHAVSKTLKLMMNLLLVGIAIGRTYEAWQRRLQSRRRAGPT
jgi:hypothetical protein